MNIKLNLKLVKVVVNLGELCSLLIVTAALSKLELLRIVVDDNVEASASPKFHVLMSASNLSTDILNVHLTNSIIWQINEMIFKKFGYEF